MNWVDTIPVALVSLAWLLVPGVLSSYAIGLRGIAAWGIAPTLSVAVIACTAAVAGRIGIAWSAPLVAVVSLVVAAVALGGRLLLRRRFPDGPERDPRAPKLAAALGLLPAVLLGAVTVVLGMGRPDNISQTYDAEFHYNAIAYILSSHNASALTLSNLGESGVPASFYPGGWHDLASLVVLSGGASIPVVANIVTAVIATVIWPLGCVLLVRQILGRNTAAMALTGLVSIGFTAYPWGLLNFGVLWPNTLGFALLPAGVAAVLSVAGVAKDDVIGRGRAWLLALPVLLAGGFAHPNSLFSLVVLAIFPIGYGLVRRAVRMRAEGRGARGWLAVGGAVLALLLGWAFAATTPIFAPVRNYNWPPFESAASAVGEALLGATNGRSALWIMAVAFLVGLVVVWRQVEQRWLVCAFALSVVLFVLAASVNSPLTKLFTGYWYNDSFRLAAVLPTMEVPLAVVGALATAEWLRRRLGSARRPSLARLGASATALVAVVALVLLVLSKGMYLGAHVTTVAWSYTAQDDSKTANLVDRRELAFYDRIKPEVPADAVVANNPWDGSALIWTLIDRRPLYPHLDLAWSPDQTYLAKHLVDAGSDPKVCAAANRLHVRYLLLGNLHYWPTADKQKDYPGIKDPAGRPGFQLVDSDGSDLKLYRITACGAGSATDSN